MNTILVWILVSTSFGGHSYGVSTVIGHFNTEQMCLHVAKSLPRQGDISARCIQAEIIK